jgi:uncharacterized iron-regulated membrane protein
VCLGKLHLVETEVDWLSPTRIGFVEFVAMSTMFRIISGAAGITLLGSTLALALYLLAEEPAARVLLAGYMGIGGIIFGAYFLFYAITGEWRPNLTNKKRERQG